MCPRPRRSPTPAQTRWRRNSARAVSTYLPTIKQLQYLDALHEHGHYGKAADASFVSQSTLSAGIRELESLL